MTCGRGSEHLADMLLAPESVPAAARAHVETCAPCREELTELQATMAAMDDWTAPDPTPYFNTRLMARLRSEQAAAPASLWERVRARILFGSNMQLRPFAAGALALMLVAGGGTFAGLNMHQKAAVQESAAVHDLQNLDGNAQVFQQLDSLDQTDNDADSSSNSNL
ncbi:MAG TPA: hypothetical protein VGD59_03250 [Acidisarcina sp.]